MFNPLTPVNTIRKSAQLTLQVRRERNRIAKSVARVQADREIRHAMIAELKSLGYLKEGVC
jgi:hypothetical protein